MSHPKAYDPQPGYKYQIFTRSAGTRDWEHCDYAENWAERERLIREYRMAYGLGFEFHTVRMPVKCWPEPYKPVRPHLEGRPK